MLASVNGTRIFFDVDGARVVFDGDKEIERPVLLMLPGGPGSSHTHYKRPRAGFLRLHDIFQMVYVDWRGAARSDPAPPETMTLPQVVDDVEAIRDLLGIEQWAVLGASGGGIWALAYAGKYPERVSHLIVLHSSGRIDYFPDKAEEMARKAGITDEEAIAIYRAFVGGTLEGPVEDWAPSLRKTILQTQNVNYVDPRKHPEVVERRTKNWTEAPTDDLYKELDASRWYLRDFQTSYNAADFADRITCPTLVMTGETDPVAPPSQSEEIAKLVAGAELFVHAGGHMPHGDEQGPFFDKIVDFFARHGIETYGTRS